MIDKRKEHTSAQTQAELERERLLRLHERAVDPLPDAMPLRIDDVLDARSIGESNFGERAHRSNGASHNSGGGHHYQNIATREHGYSPQRFAGIS